MSLINKKSWYARIIITVVIVSFVAVFVHYFITGSFPFTDVNSGFWYTAINVAFGILLIPAAIALVGGLGTWIYGLFKKKKS
jgi:hypothetical protein